MHATAARVIAHARLTSPTLPASQGQGNRASGAQRQHVAEEGDIEPSRLFAKVTVRHTWQDAGTDIKHGEASEEHGGLHVICTEKPTRPH